jgi:hypothetical protein
VAIFQVGQKVDVSGVSKGKGFSGVIKRHHFSSNRASHGNSVSHNKPGSIGMAQDPGRVFPGKKMAGHLGAANRTAQNLVIVRIDAERQLLLISGAVPGSKGGDVAVYPAIKAAKSVVSGKAANASGSSSPPTSAARIPMISSRWCIYWFTQMCSISKDSCHRPSTPVGPRIFWMSSIATRRITAT